MRKIQFIILVILIVILTVFPIYFASAQSVFLDREGDILYKLNGDDIVEFNLVDKKEFCHTSNKIAVKGNCDNICLNEVKTLLEKSQVVVLYNLESEKNEKSDSLLTNSNASVFYYSNNVLHSCTFKSHTTNRLQLESEVNEYINEKLATIDTVESLQSQNEQCFSPLYSSSFREMRKPFGYIDCDYQISKYRVNDVSSLYLLEAHAYFTPGSIAMKNGSTGFENYQQMSGYMHITASRAMNEVGYGQIRYGGTPIFKDAYPVNKPGTITVSSSYSKGTTLGYSFKNGFSRDGISIDSGLSVGKNIVRGYDKSYTTTEPALSAQKNAENPQKFEWYYEYKNIRAETNHMLLGYMFEMNNDGHDLFEGDLAVRFDYEMTARRPLWFPFTFSGYNYNSWY